MTQCICRHCGHSTQHACLGRAVLFSCANGVCGLSAHHNFIVVCNTSACVLARSCSAKLYLCSAAVVGLLSCIARMHVFRPGVLRDSPSVGVQLALGPCCWLAFFADAAVGCSLVVQLSAAEASAMQRLAPVCARKARMLSCSGCCAVHCILSIGVQMGVLCVMAICVSWRVWHVLLCGAVGTLAMHAWRAGAAGAGQPAVHSCMSQQESSAAAQSVACFPVLSSCCLQQCRVRGALLGKCFEGLLCVLRSACFLHQGLGTCSARARSSLPFPL